MGPKPADVAKSETTVLPQFIVVKLDNVLKPTIEDKNNTGNRNDNNILSIRIFGPNQDYNLLQDVHKQDDRANYRQNMVLSVSCLFLEMLLNFVF